MQGFFRWGAGRFLLVLAVLAQAVFFVGGRAQGADEVLPAYGEQLLAAINRYRQGNGLPGLQADQTLLQLAGEHSRQMQRARLLSHNQFGQRFASSGSSLCVENVGWNYDTADDLLAGWAGSATHNHNLLKVGIRRAGIATAGTYVTFFACN